MKVAELVETLELVAPTLASAGMIPICEHFWFTGKHVVTYDDHLAMQAPCDIGLQLTIPSRLLPLLKASSPTGTVEFTEADKDVTVRVGKNNAKFPTSDIKDANLMFKMPKVVPNAPALHSKLQQARRAIEVSMLAISNDPQYPERSGITLLQEDKGLSLYAFNNSSIARSHLDVPTKLNARITVPTQFWSIFLSLTKGSKEDRHVEVTLDSDKALAQVDGVTLFAKTLPVDQPTDVRKIFDKHFSEQAEENLTDITEELVESVARAAVLAKGDDNAHTTLSVKKGKLYLYTDSLKGEGDDVVDFDHPDVAELRVRPERLLAALDEFNESTAKVSITDRVVALANSNSATRVFMLSGRHK